MKWRWACAVLVIVRTALAQPALAATDVSRDDEIFGAQPKRSPNAAETEASQDKELFGESTVTEDNLAARVDEHNNFLAIGGQFYLRYEWDAKEVGNWHNFPVTSPNLLDIYFDARPNDRLRGYVRGRLAYNPTVDPNAPAPPTVSYLQAPQELQVLLDELWLKFDIERTAFITVGRQLVRWGSGRFWNPTDFVNPFHRDALAVFDQRVGITLLKINFPWESRNWNYYVVVNLDSGNTFEQLDLIGRAEMLVGPGEIALSVAKRPDGSLQFGADVSAGVGIFDVRMEGSLQHGLMTPFYIGNNAMTAAQISRQKEWLLQLMTGAEATIKYSDEDAMVLGVEYFYNQLGYDSVELFPVVLQHNVYTPLYFGRHYLAAYAQFAKPRSFNNTTLILSVLGNLSDMSALARYDWIVRVLSYMDFNAYVTYHFGHHGELRYQLPAALEPFVPAGVSLATPVSEVGLGLRLYF